MNAIEHARRKVQWAERKADEASQSAAPWALGNLRLYQNLMVKFMRELSALELKESES